MRILIVGAGIIGVIYGWALSQSGAEVTHLVRKGRMDQFKDGVKLDILDERKGHPKYNVTDYAGKCVEKISPSDEYELFIVPTNVHQTEGPSRNWCLSQVMRYSLSSPEIGMVRLASISCYQENAICWATQMPVE